jgi:hypothetical protein
MLEIIRVNFLITLCVEVFIENFFGGPRFELRNFLNFSNHGPPQNYVN